MLILIALFKDMVLDRYGEFFNKNINSIKGIEVSWDATIYINMLEQVKYICEQVAF